MTKKEILKLVNKILREYSTYNKSPRYADWEQFCIGTLRTIQDKLKEGE